MTCHSFLRLLVMRINTSKALYFFCVFRRSFMSTVLSYVKPSLLKTSFKLLSSTARRKPTLGKLPLKVISVPFAVFKKSSLCEKFGYTSFCLFWLTAASRTQKESMTEEIIKRADELYNEHKLQDIYDHLVKHNQSDSVEILWRLARAAIDVGKLSKDKEFRKAKIYEAAEIMERAMKLDTSNGFVHKWYAISIKYTGEYEGTKKQIQNAYKIKEHLTQASELNPKDSTTLYALGSWAFTFADMGWMTRKLAATIFDKPPSATYEEALAFFEKAEEMNPNFFSMNLLMIGKVYNALGKKDKAIEFLRHARDFSPKVLADDHEANEEATQLLSKLGVKN